MSERNSGIPVKRKPSVNSPVSSHNSQDVTDNSGIGSETDKQNTETPAEDKSENFKRKQKLIDVSKEQNDQGMKNPGVRCAEKTNKDVEYTENSDWLYYSLLAIVTLTAFVTRLYRIEFPAWVCWDETHFGKMGSWYINRTFFFDVHPPLGKMLIGLSGYLSGYDGQFGFEKPGDNYKETKYVGMRVFCACLGAALVPLTYMTTWLLSRSPIAALFAACFVLFDVGTNTLSRHILLDPILMFFIMVSTYCLLKFITFTHRPFSLSWWFWLSCTGVAISCSISVKFVGLFVVLLTGYTTICDLWRILGEEKFSLADVMKHFLARAVCLICIPVVCYMLIFAVHFSVLSSSGNGDGFFSSQFQSQLEGNRLHNVSMPEHIAYGSAFTLKQRRTGGAYLHSHWHLYPESHPPRQQQITTYSHKDTNNMWLLKHPFEEPDPDSLPITVKNGDLVRLEHIQTRRNLHSHTEPAPLTNRHFQVAGYGEDGKGDANDIWQVVVPGLEEGAPVQVVTSKLKLIHYHVQCALQSHDKKLPKWGYDQLEVTCNPNIKDSKTFWSIEEVYDKRLPNISIEVHAPSFLDKFVESHSVMTQGNSGLKPKVGEVSSRPWEWPVDWKGQVFSGKEHRIYLLGNPVIFMIVLVVKLLFIVLYVVYAVKRQRKVKMSPEMRLYAERTFACGWWLLIGWGLHYLPFWPMTRILYFHHYFPAFLYSAMLAGVTIEYMIVKLCMTLSEPVANTLFHVCTVLVMSACGYSFYLFHPLTYGMSGPNSHDEKSMMYGLKWLDTWEF